MRRTKLRHAVALGAVALVAASQGAGAAASRPVSIPPPVGAGDRVETLPNGLYRVTLEDGYTFTTHGADPVATELGHGESLGPGDPERAPICGTGHVQHVLFGRPPGLPSRYDDFVEEIRAHVRRMNAVLNEAAEESGGTSADYRVACDEAGEIRVDEFVNTSAVPYITTIIMGARDAGFDDPNVDYSVFYDGEFPGVCGIAEFSDDTRLEESNANNDGGYAVTYENCWFSRTPMHENGHNQGAVQTGPPGSDGGGHCTEHEDIMCYPSTEMQCPGNMYFDCGFDTYFDAAPEPGEWLESHWNLASPLNRYIVLGGADVPVDPVVSNEAFLKGPARPPRGARITLRAGLTEACSEEAEVIALQRKKDGRFVDVADTTLDDECEAAFKLRASFGSATFRSSWTSEEGDVLTSRPLRIRTRS
ncbi:MAG TPA: hypothetical protein VG318_11765 [Actinomycetota bacterium]|nr:hypothetical protein [Actinomycetota bacterium]